MPELKPNFRLVISCGGTGGHFYPGLSVARELNADGGEALLLLSGVNAEHQGEIAAAAGVRAVVLPPMPSPNKIANLSRFVKGLFGGLSRGLRAMDEFAPDAFLGMGSFASAPPFLAAKIRRLPTFLHDGNARIGRANRWASCGAKRLWTAFPAVNAKRVFCRCETIGMPLRPEITGRAPLTKQAAIEQLNAQFSTRLSPDLTTILVFGGSQGAQIFNRTLPGVLRKLQPSHPLQVLHLSGAGKMDDLQEAYRGVTFPYFAAPSSDRMDLLMQAADLAVCRSGGSTVAELAYYGVPSVLIPYPYAAEGHQENNAEYLSDAGAAVLLRNSECTEACLYNVIDDLFATEATLPKMREAARKQARPRATQDLLAEIRADCP